MELQQRQTTLAQLLIENFNNKHQLSLRWVFELIGLFFSRSLNRTKSVHKQHGVIKTNRGSRIKAIIKRREKKLKTYSLRILKEKAKKFIGALCLLMMILILGVQGQ